MDWEFFFSSEAGRDRLLRDRLDEYQSAAADARHRQGQQFNRTINALKGDLEVRLTALTRAFEAYVELDDVREQLAGFPQHALTRRRATEALAIWMAGGEAERIDDVPDYWLPAAVNALRPGGLNAADVATARSRDAQSTDRFLTGVLGAAGSGAGGEHALAVLGTPAEGWDEAQQLVWLAVADDVFGPAVIEQLRSRVEPVLAAPSAGWSEWLMSQGRTVEDVLQWVMRVFPPNPDVPEPDHARHRDDLRSVAMIEVTEGSPQEQELFVRARQLREAVRNPWRTASDAAPTKREVIAMLRASAADDRGRVGEVSRRWIAPHLVTVLDELEIRDPDPQTTTAKSGGWSVPVDAAGPDAEEFARVRQLLIESHTPSNLPLIRGGAIGGALLVVAVVLWLVSWTTLAVIVAIVALGVGAYGFWQWQREQLLVEAGQDAISGLDQAVDRAHTTVVAADREAAEKIGRTRELLNSAREVLAGAATGVRAVPRPAAEAESDPEPDPERMDAESMDAEPMGEEPAKAG